MFRGKKASEKNVGCCSSSYKGYNVFTNTDDTLLSSTSGSIVYYGWSWKTHQIYTMEHNEYREHKYISTQMWNI